MKAKRPDEPVEIHWENLEYSLQAKQMPYSSVYIVTYSLLRVGLEYPESTIEYSLVYSMALQSRLAPSWQNRILLFAFTSSINMMTIAVSCVCINYIAKLQVRRAAP